MDIKFRVICSNTMKVAQQRDLFSVPVLSWAHMRDKAGILLLVAGYVRRSMDITYLHGSTCPSTVGTQCKQCDQCVDIVYRDLLIRISGQICWKSGNDIFWLAYHGR